MESPPHMATEVGDFFVVRCGVPERRMGISPSNTSNGSRSISDMVFTEVSQPTKERLPGETEQMTRKSSAWVEATSGFLHRGLLELNPRDSRGQLLEG